MKNKITLDQLKEAQAILEKHGHLLDEKNKEPVMSLPYPEKLFEIGSLNHPADRESYFSYSGALSIAKDYSKVKRDEIFGIWEGDTYSNGKLWALAYRGEVFNREVEEES